MGRMHSDAQFAGQKSEQVTTQWQDVLWHVLLTLLLRLISNLVNVIPSVVEESHYQISTETSFRGCLFFVGLILSIKTPIFMDRTISCNQCTTCFRWTANGYSLSKTFDKQVYNINSKNSELALVKLMELFNHSSIAITMRYLCLRQEEILQTYDCLTF